MGLVGPSIYLDSCLAIYLIEENASFVSQLEKALEANFDSTLCISPLTEMECLIMPLREKNEMYQAFDRLQIVTVQEILDGARINLPLMEEVTKKRIKPKATLSRTLAWNKLCKFRNIYLGWQQTFLIKSVLLVRLLPERRCRAVFLF